MRGTWRETVLPTTPTTLEDTERGDRRCVIGLDAAVAAGLEIFVVHGAVARTVVAGGALAIAATFGRPSQSHG